MTSAVWEPLTGGRTNFAWKVTPADGSAAVVAKLYRGPAKNPLFPNDPKAEARALRLLESTGLAPRLVAELVTAAGACNIYTHIPGSGWTGGSEAAGRVVKFLHSLSPPEGFRTVPNGSKALEEKTVSILGKCKNFDSLTTLKPQGEVPAVGRVVLLHGDIVPGNLIHSEQGVHLIDWQCPAIGDPCEDLAMFLSPAMQYVYRGLPLSDKEVLDFLDAYGDTEVSARYRMLAPWYHWRMVAYCQWQSENGRSDYAPARDLEIAALQRSLKA